MNGPMLRDIHLPPVDWWPPAPGWWVLAALLALAAIGAAWWWRRVARSRPVRVAMREIDALEVAHARDEDTTLLADGASRLMRRVARRIAPDVAAQTGMAWHAFVRLHAPDETTRQILDTLASERFRARPMLEVPALLAALRAWCREALRRPAASSRRVAARAARAFAFAPPFVPKGVVPHAQASRERVAS